MGNKENMNPFSSSKGYIYSSMLNVIRYRSQLIPFEVVGGGEFAFYRYVIDLNG